MISARTKLKRLQYAATESRDQRGHQTQWAAQFAVASELCKRGYEVSFTMGNATPVADLMVVSVAPGHLIHRSLFVLM